MRQARLGLLMALVTTSMLASAAGAEAHDTLESTRFEMREKTHDVSVRLEHAGYATLVVTRTVENPGPKSDQAIFHLNMPEGAVATRLRTSGVSPNGETVWFEGELMEAEAAAKKYQELTGIGGFYPKDPALLSWRNQRLLALQVFPVPARGTKTIEYTVQMPLVFEDGAYHLKLGPLGTATLPAKLRVTAANADDVVAINDVVSTTAGSSITASKPIDITLKPAQSAVLEGTLASHGFATERNLVHARVTTPAMFSQVPQRPSIVVLLDVSRSMEPMIDTELAAARAYLSGFANGDVEVLTFDRKVHSPFGGVLPVREALSRLYGLHTSITPANGSAVDEAIMRADAKLSQMPNNNNARRIVTFTDMRTRDALVAARFGARILGSGAVLHVATIDSGATPSLTRDDDSPWSKLPRATGGLFWHATAQTQADEEMRRVYSELVRPKRLEKLNVRGMPEDFSVPLELWEGNAIEHLSIGKKGVPTVAIDGELWSRPVHWSMNASAAEAKRWSALVFGSAVLHELEEKEMMTLAVFGRAVSPVTSYLAIEPGVRPSNEGLEDSEIGFGAMGSGMGFGRLSGMHATGGRGPGLDRQRFLETALANAVKACKRTSEASASIETTLTEIVDVIDVKLIPSRDPAGETCITENLWSVSLPPAFLDEHAMWTATSK